MDTNRRDLGELALWVAVTCCALHVVEEVSLSWPRWAQSLGIATGWTDYYVANAVFLVFGIAAAMVGWRSPSFSLGYPAMLLLNVAFHVGATLYSWRLNPGTITAVALLLPSSIGCFLAARRQHLLTLRVAMGALLIGGGIHAWPILLLALRPRLGY